MISVEVRSQHRVKRLEKSRKLQAQRVPLLRFEARTFRTQAAPLYICPVMEY
jgi:hypothetical protein